MTPITYHRADVNGLQVFYRQAGHPGAPQLLLAIWGRNDPFFLPAGAQAFKRDIPRADVQLLDTGHFALETHADEIATAIRKFVPDQQL